MITITCLANAALLLTNDTTTLLIDGLYRSAGHSFDPLPAAVEQQLLAGTLKKVDHLLFTHCHSDHFSAAKTKRFLQNNPVKSLWLPADIADSELKRHEPASLRIYRLPGTAGDVRRQQIESGLTITALGSAHIGGEEFTQDTHTSFLLTWQGKKLLVTGDAHPDHQVFTSVLGKDPDQRPNQGQDQRQLDAAFVNPIFYNNEQGCHLLHQCLKPKSLFLYHLPAPQRDRMGLRSATQYLLKKHKDEDCQLQAFMQPMATVTIE